MKHVVACLVLAGAMAGCGDGESGWQADWRTYEERYVDSYLEFPGLFLEDCEDYVEVGREQGEATIRYQRFPNYALESILEDYGLVQTDDIIDEAVQIVFDEFERACP